MLEPGWTERIGRGEINAVLIAGPTASGKSAVAFALAEKFGGVIINADSMQAYRELRVLSARPTVEEELRVPHRLYGHVEAGFEYSVGDYLRDAEVVLAELQRARKLAIIVGGTGLYFKALTSGFVATPEVPVAIRDAWETAWKAGDDLYGALMQRDPEAALALKPADAPRLIRALEVFEATGRSILEWRREAGSTPLLEPGRWTGIFLNPERAALFARIDFRFIAMIEQGALDEVRRIALLGLPANRGIMKAHGVPHLMAHLRGEISLDEAIARGQRDTRHYAKRQMTWARQYMADWAWYASGEEVLRSGIS